MNGYKVIVYLSLIVFTSLFILPSKAYAYFDPGAGSMIFQLLVAAGIGALFTLKVYWKKIKNYFGSSKKHDNQ